MGEIRNLVIQLLFVPLYLMFCLSNEVSLPLRIFDYCDWLDVHQIASKVCSC